MAGCARSRRDRIRARPADPAEPVRAGGGRRHASAPFAPIFATSRGSRAAIAECRPEVVIHMAAQSVVRRGYEDPIETYSSNVMGTVHVLEALRQLKQPCAVVNVTSDKCYENREWVWGYRENEPMGGRDPYSNSKGCAELVTTAYRESFFPPESIRPSRRRPRQRSCRECDRRRRLDQRPAHSRPHEGFPCRPALPDPKPFRYPAMAVRSGAAARIPHARGATRGGRPRASPRAGTLAPPTRTPSRCPGLRTNWRGRGESSAVVESGCRSASAGGPLSQVGRLQGEGLPGLASSASLEAGPRTGLSSGTVLSRLGPIFELLPERKSSGMRPCPRTDADR